MAASRASSLGVRTHNPYFDSIPDELIIEILKRLPQDLIHRCYCVSKRWLNLISSNNFIRCYIQYNASLPNSKPPFALFYRNNNTFHAAFSENPIFKLSGFSLDFLPISFTSRCSDPFNVLSSNNGLVLCESVFQDQYFVCNPLTKQWITVPQRPTSILSIYSGFVCKSTSNNTSFRIVNTLYWGISSPKSYVYNSESRIWTEIIFDRMSLNKYFCDKEAIACNGLLHWENKRDSIFVYDPFNGDNNYKIVRVPNEKKRGVIRVTNERLRYLERGAEKFLLWELEDYDMGKWRLVQEIYFSQMDHLRIFNEDFSSITLHPFDEDILFLQKKDEIIWCNNRLQKLVSICSLAGCRNLRVIPISLPWWPVPVPLH